ncbi:MAG: SDR family NAD(P)-dependent oxidoreductase [Flavobacteriales bacterium]|nr:SDR family NAD(P)-dependent oxidoreductase [Flavobacteriales bacterium]
MNSILITGAGSGIGAATARRLSQHEGVRLLLLGRRMEPLRAVRDTLKESGNHVVVSLDVSRGDALVDWLSGEEANLNRHPLVGVFANAGVGGPNAFGPEDRWEEIIRINLTGTYNTLMACYPHLKASPGVTHALVTSSVLARFGVPGQTAYVASKTGLLGLVRSLAVEWSPEGIMVNALCPGWVETEMARNSIQAMADAQGITYGESKAQQEAILPAGRVSSPDEMAQWVDFLFSGLGEGEEVARVETFTGQALDVNSGSWMG